MFLLFILGLNLLDVSSFHSGIEFGRRRSGEGSSGRGKQGVV